MQNQVRLTMIPHSNRRLQTLPVRALSQQNYKARNNNRIKINLKRLPTDFFSGPSSMPEINSLCKISSKCHSIIQSLRRQNQTQNSNLHIRMIETRQKSETKELRSYKSQMRSRQPNLNDNSCDVSYENNNMMNWTFSRQLFSQQKRQKVFSGVKYKFPTERSQSLDKDVPRKVESKSSRVGGEQGMIRNINNLLSDKIAELNLNRLRMNIRKNNHPQQTMQFIRKYCG